MDFGGLLVLGLVWLLFNLIGQGKGKARTASRGSPRAPTPQPGPGGVDATQQEGSRLERLLRELERNLEEVAGQQQGAGRGPRPRNPLLLPGSPHRRPTTRRRSRSGGHSRSPNRW